MRWRVISAVLLLTLAGASPLGTARGASAAPSDYAVRGIDVSHWQGAIDWAAVAASGEHFAYAKVSQGMTFVDKNYLTNRSGALTAGVHFGGYHYAEPDLGNPRGQADRLIDLGGYARPLLGTGDTKTVESLLPPMLDIEWDGETPSGCYGLTPTQMVDWITQFVDQVRVRTGRQTMIYTNPYWWNPCTNYSTKFGSNPLFVSRYTADPPTPEQMPAGWTRWTLWQYTSTGSVPGVTGNVDRDVFYGTATQLLVLNEPVTRPVSPER